MSTLRCLKIRLPVSNLSRSATPEERIAPGIDIVDQFRRQILVHTTDLKNAACIREPDARS